MPVLPHAHAVEWITRWDRQQEGYIPDREKRFEVIIDAVEASVRRSDPLVIDLGCGPGSLAVRLLDRLPGATVVAVDADPLLLTLGRAAHGDRPGLRLIRLDLRRPGWSRTLGLERPADAAVSTTALHWLPEHHLREVYAELAGVLRPGGIFVNGDHMGTADAQPRLGALEREVHERAVRRSFADARPEDWRQWWDALHADPEIVAGHDDHAATSEASGHSGSETLLLSTHVSALRAAGFTETAPLWQHGDDRVLAALLP